MKPSIFAIALAVTAAGALGAQEPAYKRDVPDSLASQAKISETTALATAQRRMQKRKGKVTALELEHERGKLMWSFEFKVPRKSGIDEVNIDAMSGKVIGVSHEGPATEKREAAEEAKGEKKAAAKRP